MAKKRKFKQKTFKFLPIDRQVKRYNSISAYTTGNKKFAKFGGQKYKLSTTAEQKFAQQEFKRYKKERGVSDKWLKNLSSQVANRQYQIQTRQSNRSATGARINKTIGARNIKAQRLRIDKILNVDSKNYREVYKSLVQVRKVFKAKTINLAKISQRNYRKILKGYDGFYSFDPRNIKVLHEIFLEAARVTYLYLYEKYKPDFNFKNKEAERVFYLYEDILNGAVDENYAAFFEWLQNNTTQMRKLGTKIETKI